MKKYVVKYSKKDTGELIGYHTSTLCSHHSDIDYAKVYANGTQDKQLEIIKNNLQYIIHGHHGTFLKETMDNARDMYWNGINAEDVEVSVVEIKD